MLTMWPRFALVVVSTYSKVRAGGRQHVLQGVRVGASTLLDAHPDDVEVLLEEDEVSSLAGHVDGGLDRQARVGAVHRRCIVDPVAEEADDVPGLLQGQNDALLLARVDLGEEDRVLGRIGEPRLQGGIGRRQ